ncbi:MAG: hypothetical protein LBL58_13140 [Tannerellaceae bacterium]|jgi:hypothetical protein|nr:hypothetical protein [Tannerellaceae bacterium]
MKKWSLLWIIFLVSCSVEYSIIPDIPKSEGEQEVSIKITFPGSERVKTKSPSTYAITAEDENTVKTLDIFAFASAGDNAEPSEDIFMYRVTVPESKIANADGSGATKNVITSLRRLPQKQRFVFVANLPSSISLNLVEGVTTQQEIADQLKFDGSLWHSAQMSNDYTPIPMWGQKKDSILINSASSLDLGKVYLIRSMARIDVGVVAGLTDFKIKNIYVCNSSDSGYIAPYQSQWGEQVITKTNTTSNRVGAPVVYSFPASGDLERTIYVPETDSLIVNGIDSVKPAYLVIQAEYKNADNFYRVDFTKDRKYYPLLRNHGYVTRIMGAKEGYQSLEEAQNAPMSDFNFSLLLDDNENSDINEVVYLENQYMLGINVSEVLFDWDKPWIGKPLSGATEYYPLSVYTTYSGGWTATLSGASWVALDGATTGAKETPGEVKIKAIEENRTGKEREAKLLIRAGMLTKEVTIRQSGGANSRMICFGSGNVATTRIPLAFANEARGGNDLFVGLSATNDIEAKIIWQETGGGQSTFTAKVGTPATYTYTKECHIEVTATAGTKKSGNAVVAIVRKGSGVSIVGGIDEDEVLWSWHIWCTPDNDYMDESYHNPNVSSFMKRTLGQYDGNKGMFYQWGRKDPFPYASTDVTLGAIVNRPVEKADNRLDAIMNPASFYYKVPPTYLYWTGSSPVSDLWQTTKTYNDPCPVGWRVPDKSAKTFWTTGTVSDFLNGYLSEDSGVWDSNGNSGSLWTLTGTGDSRDVFMLSSSGGLTDGSSDFSAGHSVRCIKDIQLIKTSL